MFCTESPSHARHSVGLAERNHAVNGRVTLPQFSQFLACQHRNGIGRACFAKALQSRSCHHSVPEPVDAAHQNFGGSNGSAWSRSTHSAAATGCSTGAVTRAAFQRLCTQNQFAGSRQTAASNARFTSCIIAAVERGFTFSYVGISSLTYKSHF